jgi:hypothetical protein
VGLVGYIVSVPNLAGSLSILSPSSRSNLAGSLSNLAGTIFFVVKNLEMNDKICTFVITNLYYIYMEYTKNQHVQVPHPSKWNLSSKD